MSLENNNAWQAACRLFLNQILSAGVGAMIPPQSVSGGVTTFNYPAGGVTAISNVYVGQSPTYYLIELDVAAADEDLICTGTVHGTAAPSAGSACTVTIGFPPPGPGPGGTYPSLNRGYLDPSFFRTVDFTVLSNTNTPLRTDPTSCDLVFERLPQAQLQSQI